jgi:hypothetical protein
VRGRRKSILAAAAIAGAIVLGGCTTTQEIDQTQSPYASISDEGREPPAPPPQQTDDDSPGFWHSAFHFILVGLGFHVD